MSSKSKILTAIAAAKAAPQPLPKMNNYAGLSEDKCQYFLDALEGLGVEVIMANHKQELVSLIKQRSVEGPVYCGIKDIGVTALAEGQDLSSLNLAVVEGKWGVAENGAIWVEGDDLPHRALTAIATNLMIALPSDRILWNMHEAYQKIAPQQQGYGVFISGPSKTADIEQSLVKGAHGAKSLTVFIYNKE
ncbi:hypothetical protein PEDI_53110 [Persicobacter diffluens]|uniref:LUD domain-containing protein n=2 Tax=Persicobacter diffluens TaxID=981 RepID=A0AAN4W4K7_9BACT|nr:hypothetical protein PEDI_53110 [Persicobacter diffluens]